MKVRARYGWETRFYRFICILAIPISLAYGQVSLQRLNSIRFASEFGGADWGTKVNAASWDLGATAGEIWMDQSAGLTNSTAVSIPSNQVLRFIQGGTYWTSAKITVHGHIVGSGSGELENAEDNASTITRQGLISVANAPTIIKQANASNLATLIKFGTNGASARDIEIDGNKANNGTAGECIFVSASGVKLENVTVHDCKTYGGRNQSSGPLTNTAAVTRLKGFHSYNNDSHGWYCEDATDLWVTNQSQFELNGGNGILLSDCGGSRIIASDLAKNTLEGLLLKGVTGQIGSSHCIITANQFGNGKHHDLHVDGHDGVGYVSVGNTVTGNKFFGGDQRVSDTFSAIVLENTLANSIGGNTIDSTLGHTYKHGIAVEDTGNSGLDRWFGNISTGTFGTAEFNPKAGFTAIDGRLEVSIAWDPPSIADGAVAAVALRVAGAIVGDPAVASHDQLGANNLLLSAHVQSAGIVRVHLLNKTGEAHDVPSGTLTVVVRK